MVADMRVRGILILDDFGVLHREFQFQKIYFRVLVLGDLGILEILVVPDLGALRILILDDLGVPHREFQFQKVYHRVIVLRNLGLIILGILGDPEIQGFQFWKLL